MQARMKQPAMVIPEAFQAIQALGASAEAAGVARSTMQLAELRASQINGCSLCVDIHARMLRAMGESEERIFAVAAWRDAPWFSPAERAALALAECVTRLDDRPDPVPDAVWDEAARHYDERALAGLLLGIAAINVWNRLNVSTRQAGDAWSRSAEGKAALERLQAEARKQAPGGGRAA